MSRIVVLHVKAASCYELCKSSNTLLMNVTSAQRSPRYIMAFTVTLAIFFHPRKFHFYFLPRWHPPLDRSASLLSPPLKIYRTAGTEPWSRWPTQRDLIPLSMTWPYWSFALPSTVSGWKFYALASIYSHTSGVHVTMFFCNIITMMAPNRHGKTNPESPWPSKLPSHI